MAAASIVISFKHTTLFSLVAFSFFTVSSGCTFESDCQFNEVCCNSQCMYGSSCENQPCSSDPDCSTGERCCNSQCSADTSCAGHYCSSDSGCSDLESCCNNKCSSGSDCLGASCSTNSDCGNFETCCHGTCQYSYDDCYDTIGVIIGVVSGSLVFISLVSLCIFLACRRQRSLQGRVIVQGQGTTATTVTTTGATQGNPPHQGQIPPYYQQGYPYYPPLQYEQPQQTMNVPQPYNPGTMAASGQPPPYSAEPQGGSGGVYAPKPSYGAIPTEPPV